MSRGIETEGIKKSDLVSFGRCVGKRTGTNGYYGPVAFCVGVYMKGYNVGVMAVGAACRSSK